MRIAVFLLILSANAFAAESIALDDYMQIDFAYSCEKYVDAITDSLANGSMPLRVTHNDTKANNVIFDRKTKKPLVVIDLDTVMPGMPMYDFGDAVVHHRCKDKDGKRVKEVVDGKKVTVYDEVEKTIKKDNPSRKNAKRAMLRVFVPVTEVPAD